MANAAYELVSPIAKLAKHTVACAPFMFSPHDGAIMTSTYEVAVAATAPRSGSHVHRIGEWADRHKLNEEEMGRLQAVLTDYPAEDIAEELATELRCIIAERRLAVMPELTTETVDRARDAFESGRIPFVRQAVD